MSRSITIRNTLKLLLLFTLFQGAGCATQITRREYDPPVGTVEITSAVVPHFLAVRRYSFSPDGSYLAATGVALEHDDGGIPEEIVTDQPATVMVLEWPSLKEVWREDIPEQYVYPLAFSWSLSSDTLWITWFPDGRVTRFAIPTGETTGLEARHAGVVPSPDGNKLVAWGVVGNAKAPGLGGSTVLNTKRLFIYNTEDLALEKEVSVPVDGAVSQVYWGDDSDTLWLLVAPNCGREIYIGFPYVACADHSLYHLSLSDEVLELYWAAFTENTEETGAFNSTTNLLLDQDGGLNRITVVDLERRCTVFQLEDRFGELVWFDENKFAEMYPATMEERDSLIRVFEITALTTGEKIPCLPSE